MILYSIVSKLDSTFFFKENYTNWKKSLASSVLKILTVFMEISAVFCSVLSVLLVKFLKGYFVR